MPNVLVSMNTNYSYFIVREFCRSNVFTSIFHYIQAVRFDSLATEELDFLFQQFLKFDDILVDTFIGALALLPYTCECCM